jgi:hypothetical protein
MDDVPGERGGPERAPLLVLAGDVGAPWPVECLACYVWRMLDERGCNATLRWTRRWRAARAPRATALERRLAKSGGFCDCELFLNVWVPRTSPATRPKSGTSSAAFRESCRGVRRGSSQPCDLWVPGGI